MALAELLVSGEMEMTMQDGKCDVCHKNPPVGVASTAVPLSVAYCMECAQRHAQPLCVFVMWEESIPPNDHIAPDSFCTYENGNYVSYRKWYNARHKIQNPSTVHLPTPEGSVPDKPRASKRD
jgi:hypothetical protein